ncbi:hypothetical protein PG993_008008 [Apiospora rasikravindrae]|uniref:Myb-like DNA-binding domain-containing protein n=1 Tax=Apiospora rasikravindrae TaxID=990691 RepID=A0ABR1SZ45_9PEZI
MSPPDIESQFRFLISCIKHSNNGRVDFEAVRKECGVVTKGAAAKRFERLLKANGITGGLGNTVVKKEPATKKEAEEDDDPNLPGIKPTRGRPSNKKRKLQQVEENADDDDEPVKGEVKSEDAIHVKSELAGYANLPMMSSSQHQPMATIPPHPSGPTNDHVGDVHSDDDVMIVGAFEKTSEGGNGSKQQQQPPHQQPSRRQSPVSTVVAMTNSQMMPGTNNSFDHTANTFLPQTTHPPSPRATAPSLMTTTTMRTTPNPDTALHDHHHHTLPYAAFPGTATSPWYYQHHHHPPHHHMHHHNPSTPGIYWHNATPPPEDRHGENCDPQG